MRLAAAFFMVILLLSPSLLRLELLGYYQSNKAKIIRLHCINKNKPERHCEGKCYLQAQLQKAQNQQDNMEGIFAGWSNGDDWLPLGNFGWRLNNPGRMLRKAVVPYLVVCCIGCSLDVFRPPPSTAAWLSHRGTNEIHPTC